MNSFNRLRLISGLWIICLTCGQSFSQDCCRVEADLRGDDSSRRTHGRPRRQWTSFCDRPGGFYSDYRCQ
jgi:hypothetical protein